MGSSAAVVAETQTQMPESTIVLPRVTIQFCTQCKWMLRAAYFAQELLSTFGTSIGEVALQPSTGGVFRVHLYHDAGEGVGEKEEVGGSGKVNVKEHLLWDRKAEGGFPETKELKRRVRDIIDPKRDLGHVDGKKDATKADQPTTAASEDKGKDVDAVASSGEKEGEEKKEEDQEALNSRGKIVISGGGLGGGMEDYGYCRPGDEDCG